MICAQKKNLKNGDQYRNAGRRTVGKSRDREKFRHFPVKPPFYRPYSVLLKGTIMKDDFSLKNLAVCLSTIGLFHAYACKKENAPL